MGSSSSVHKDSPLGCILSPWNQFRWQDLREEKRIFFCIPAWPKYSLGDEEKLPTERTLNFNTIHQLNLCNEVPCVQAFMTLNQDPELRDLLENVLAQMYLVNKLPLDILDDCLNRPPPTKPRFLEEAGHP